MTDDTPTAAAVRTGLQDEAAALTSDHPQPFHNAKLASGIEDVMPGLVTLRKMADIQALTRSRAVRQFGTGAMADLLSSAGDGLGLGGHHVAIPLELDGADHTKWRKILDPVFAPKKIAALESRVRDRANELIDRFIERGEADAYAEWCDPLPSSIFLSIMGIPQAEREHFIGFKNVIIPGDSTAPRDPAERHAAYTDCEEWFAAEFDRRERSGDYGDDIIGWLLQVEVDGRRITRDELHGICNLLMIAGLDTVAASLSCILAHLARRPDERDRILADPSLWPGAIEELMRFESPVTQGFRHVVEDVELPSGTLKADTNAIVWWAAANVDPEAFEEPLDVRLDRSPNAHICFASGWHRCLGSHLARMELRAALDVWHSRIPDYRLAEGAELTYSVNPR
ncbi:MAG TPA: cytochrome P450, partial [Acidimicrobiales bacterium]|nr:cytochrome P450 [Acidimicrobiales bacterium]